MRLLSYNIHKGIGGRDRRYDLQRVIEVIEQENPDLICLQEVDHHVRRSRFHDQPHLLAHHFTAVAHLRQTNVRLKTGGYGNLVLSRWPFRSSHQISLRLATKKPRARNSPWSKRPRARCTWSIGTWGWPRRSGTGR